MFINLNGIMDIIKRWHKPKHELDIPPLLKEVEMAKQEWMYAQRMYQVAVEPELIDYASYLIKASEIKYIYLLRQVKREEIQLSLDALEVVHDYKQQTGA